MAKRLGSFLVLLMTALFAFSQPYGNEWINYNSTYYKVYVYNDGICRIPYQALVNAGLPPGVDPRSFQIFCGGEEQYIYVHGENDGLFQAGDYVEFYGKRNTGWYDTGLYPVPSDQANPNYSLFSDSSAYFFTWNASINNRRMTVETDQDFGSYVPATWFYKTVRDDYTATYLGGEPGSYGMKDPEYTAGEGYFDTPFSLGESRTKNLSTPNRYSSGPDARIEFVVIGASNYSLTYPDHHLRVQFAGLTVDTTYEGYGIFRFSRNVSPFQINSTTTFTFSSIDDLNSGADRNAIAYIQVRYPHTMVMDNAITYKLTVPDALQPKTYLNMTGFSAGASDTVRFYDLSNHRRIRTAWNGSNLQALVPNSGGDKECYITSDAQIRVINSVTPVSSSGQFVNYKTLADIKKADYYILTHQSLMTQAQQYEIYRNSSGYHAMIINVDELWDQYAYGILKDPLAIRNFMHEAYNTYATKPEYLFILGKGYRAGHEGTFPQYRKSTTYFNKTLVPSLGNPPSDLLFTNGILDSMYRPAVATGRLAARSAAHAELYLDKVIDYEQEQQTPQEWMKNVLHFGGGESLAEQLGIAAYLDQYKNIIEDTLFGAYVRTFLKTTTDPIQINQSDSLKDIINNGVSMMTFFGHAAGIGFDQSIDYPSEYNNYRKYPFLLANSCYAGDIFLEQPVSSEEFVLIANKGTIGFLASISLGVADRLHIYSKRLYENISYNMYGQPIGKIIQDVIGNVQDPSLPMKSTCLELILHGDPAIRINSAELPDYMINTSSVYFDPPIVSTETDSFNIHVISTNLGRAVNDSFVVWVVRTMPDGITTSTSYRRIKATLYKDTVVFKLPVDLVNGVGMNKFDITLDYNNEIPEYSEANNSTQVTLLIKSSDIIPVWPYEYAVIPSLPVTLKASTGYAFAPPNHYIFELDTTDAFNSPVKQQTSIYQGGGVVNWTPSFPVMTDSIVYFWRVSPDSAHSGFWNWRESSFQLINGKRGWGQAHFYQFKKDQYEYVTYNKPDRRFEFVNSIIALDCQTGYYPYIAWNEEWYKLNGTMKYIFAQLTDIGDGMIVAVFDPVSGQPWVAPNNLFGYEFNTNDTASIASMAPFIQNIPDGHHVLAYSHRNHKAESWPESVYQAYESIGSNYVRSVDDFKPYIIFGNKGAAMGTANEVMGMGMTDIIGLEDSIITNWNAGYVLSEMIGPASSWGSLHWRQRSFEGLATDSVHLSVIGFKTTGVSDTLIRDLPPDSADILNLSQRIDASEWPYLKLVAVMQDDSLHTPSQMIRWQVLYEGMPETALNPSRYFYFYDDTVQEGETIRFATATENISIYNMDSLLIRYWIIDANRNVVDLGSHRCKAHPAGDVLIDSISASTKGLPGLNSLWIEVNPFNDQLEQYHFNNIGEIYFYVNKDITNPILDVTFDGVHIMDGDIVSAKPEIMVMVKDENPYLIFNEDGDTAHFKVWLLPPGVSEPQRVWFRQGGFEQLQFVKASGSENRAHIIYRPELLQDGTYRLIVEAQDKSRNESGDINYEISFEVINKPSITAVMNWPNPFSTATHFVFTLTGSQVPDFFMIQIMTISGKVVREISKEELGNIHVGRNITDYAWDGTDMYGDRLANGIYLYRVMTRIGDEKIEHFSTEADQYFTREFGKMVLIR